MFITTRCVWYLIKTYFKSKKILRWAKKMDEWDGWQLSYDYLWEIAPDAMSKTESRIVFHGIENIPERKEKEQGILFVGNHQSYLDILVLYMAMERPTAFVSKKQLWKVPLIGAIMQGIGCEMIDRDDIRQSLNAIKNTAEKLNKGLNMIIFPEGTRSKSEEMGEFKKGFLKAATMSGSTIVPFRIQNLYAVFEGNPGFKVTPAQVDVFFGEPIEVKDMSRAEQKQLSENMKDIVASLR